MDVLTAVKQAIRDRYVWPGGYPVYVVLTDGDMLCGDCAKENYYSIAWELIKDVDYGWKPIGTQVLYYEGEQCGNCYKELESAYGEEDLE